MQQLRMVRNLCEYSAALVAAVIVPVHLSGRAAASQEDILRMLKQQTQALLDAVSTGDASVWDRYVDPDVIYVSEDGVGKTKSDLLREIKPLPKGVSGSIQVSSFHASVHGDTAVTTHVDFENENYHGHPLASEYRTTDTWIRTRQGWRLVASQVHAQLADPAEVRLPVATLDEYAGVYRLAADVSYTIRREGDRLIGQRSGRPPQTLRVEAPDVLFVAGQPRSRKIIVRNIDGSPSGFVDRREGRDLPWTKERQ
jgi:ketosteroid isomerase-like protein